MELDYYLWKHKITREKFAEDADITPSHLSTLIHKKRSPSLMTAIRIHRASHGKVSYEEMLRMQDRLIEDKEVENP